MRRLLATSALGVVILGSAGTASAQAPCDSYSGGCVKPGRDVVGGVDRTRPDRGTKLPLTGGELTVLVVIGAGAVAGGTALVTAGRRRSRTAA